MNQDSLLKKTTVLMCIFAAAAIAVICYYSSHKIVVVAESEQGQTINVAQADTANAEKDNRLTFSKDSAKTSYMCIPLEDNIRAGDIITENHYMDDQLWIGLRGATAAYYKTAQLSGRHSQVKDAYFMSEGEKLWLKFNLDNIYEYKSIFEGGKLYIEFVPPHEKYDKIVVIDAAYGRVPGGTADKQQRSGSDVSRDEITLRIMQDLKAMLDDSDIRVYYTRMSAQSSGEEKRVQLANAVKADMLIRIEVGEDSDSKVYGTQTVYNSNYFIPGFGSVELADLLEKNVTASISGKALGLKAASEDDYVVSNARVPAAAVKIGYISNAQECKLLEHDDYQEKIADGIYQAITAAYKEQQNNGGTETE
jgi:N-acetylmuramoyl-L-alanine amidase